MATNDPGSLVVVGLLDSVAVGVCLVEPSERGAGTLTIGLLYVEPEARGVGVGTALLDQAVSWATDRGATALDAPALPGDRSTKALLETAGFVTRLLITERELRGRERARS
jgi:GNAT superfamily N-acetyltransferase